MNDLCEGYEKIVENMKEISHKKISDEILGWLTKNVHNYIDNKTRAYRIDIVIDEGGLDCFSETKKLQDLYRMVPEIKRENESKKDFVLTEKEEKEISKIIELENELNSLTEQCFAEMKADGNKLSELFKAMSYFYEMKGIVDGKMLIVDLVGGVEITNFTYDNFKVPVRISDSSGLISESIIPEGFSLGLEISFVEKNFINNSLF